MKTPRERITVSGLLGSDGPTSVDDVVFLPPYALSPAQLGRIGKWLRGRRWFRKIAARHGLRIAGLPNRFVAFPGMDVLRREMADSMVPTRLSYGGAAEPAWMGRLPRDARKFLRCEFAIIDGVDPLAICPSVPYLGFGYIVRDYERRLPTCVSEAHGLFRLARLQRVKQLSFLRDPVLREVDRSAAAMPFDHTRLCHSFDVLAIATLMAAICHLPAAARRVLEVAALTHDALTPAGGDSTKLVDPAAFDEDAHYAEFLQGGEWEAFSARWGIDGVLLTATVRGEGLLGELLDLADKLAYVARDTRAYLGHLIGVKPECFSSGYYVIADIARRNPDICALWKSVRVEKGRVVISDANRLASFLELRAFLFRELYYNPHARFFECLFGRGVTKYLYRTGKITREQLLTWGDLQLEDRISKLFSVPFIHGLSSLEHARIEEQVSPVSAYERAEELDKSENILPVVDEFRHVSNAATGRFLVRDGGRVIPFRDARPKLAEQIERLMEFPSVVRVFIFNLNDLSVPHEARRRVKDVFRSLRSMRSSARSS